MIPSTNRSVRYASRHLRPDKIADAPNPCFEQIHRQARPRKDRLKNEQQYRDQNHQSEEFVRQNAVDLFRNAMLLRDRCA